MTEQPVLSRKRILLIDDQAEVRETIRMVLELDEHIVVEAANGREGLALFAPEAFDLVITDYAMPEMTGDQLARRIKDLAPWQAVLMVTGSPVGHKGFDNAADAILPKPFMIADLRQCIAGLCQPRTQNHFTVAA